MFSNTFSKLSAILTTIATLASIANAAQLRGGSVDGSSTARVNATSIFSPISRRDTDEAAAAASSSTSSFDCYLYEMDGLEPPGFDIPSMWNCEIEATETEEGKQYTFIGDVVEVLREKFHEDVEIVGSTRMTVPFDAILGNTTLIDIQHPGIVISHDRVRHRRRLAQKTGWQKVLIVRAIDRNGNSPAHSASQLKNDFFDDENNLSSRMKACSNNKLKIIPATGPGVNNGVLNIRFDDINFNGMNWQAVGDKISTRLSRISGLNYATRIFLLPNTVAFGGAAAWAQVGGGTIWLKDQFASFPIVQVHEYGHLLGQRHSGANGNSYSDNSCYMGNQVPWTDQGALMCFNAAKTWYFGWYSNHHREINPVSQAFNEDIVGIADVVNGVAGSKRVIIKINSDSNDFFLMYNRAKGINSGALGGADEVTITKQNGSNKDSSFVESLKTGQQWVYNNFGSTGRNLVVKHCYNKQNTANGDTARVLIYIQGLNDQTCGTEGGSTGGGSTGGGSTGGGSTGGGSTGGGSTGGGSTGGGSTGGGSGSCTDKNFVDNWGDTCSYYAINNRCNTVGNNVGKYNNLTARQACCVCGGGNRSAADSPGTDSNSGANNGACRNDDSWHDAGGAKYNCEWYKSTPTACAMYGNRFKNLGKTANEACCVCKR